MGHARHGAAPGAARGGVPAAPDPESERPAAGRHRRRRSRRGLLLLTALLLGGALAVLAAGAWWPFTDRPAGGASSPTAAAESPDGTTAVRSAALAPLPATAGTADERLASTTTAVADVLADDPGALGPAGEDVLAVLRRVQASDGPVRRLAAVVAGDSVTVALDAGRLDAQAGQRVLETLATVARPNRLIDVVEALGQDPAAVGPAGPGLVDDLLALDHTVPADRTAARAAELVAAVTAAAADGQVSEAFRDMTVPKLEQLADPAAYQDLQDLLSGVERDPGRVGPAARQVLESLRAVAELPVHLQGNTALDLLALLGQDGQVTTAFREEAVPVLEALVR